MLPKKITNGANRTQRGKLRRLAMKIAVTRVSNAIAPYDERRAVPGSYSLYHSAQPIAPKRNTTTARKSQGVRRRFPGNLSGDFEGSFMMVVSFHDSVAQLYAIRRGAISQTINARPTRPSLRRAAGGDDDDDDSGRDNADRARASVPRR